MSIRCNENKNPTVVMNVKNAILEAARKNITYKTVSHVDVPGIQSDANLAELSIYHGMIVPFVHTVVNNKNGHKCISYGCSSYGYDLRLGKEVLVFVPSPGAELDPLNFDKGVLQQAEIHVDEKTGFEYIIVPANGFVLGHSVEYIKMPKDMTSIILGKSTYARAGLVCIATPLEAGWEGQVTLEFANTTPVPVRMYIDQGCAQALFYRGLTDCRVDYSMRSGKYQGQTGVTLPKG